MGIVYQARQVKLNRVVALKMIRGGRNVERQDLVRFRVEAEAVARLDHPNIVRIYDFGEHDGLPYFAMEFVDGGSLSQNLNGVPLEPREAAQLVEWLARTVHYVHQCGIVHRDLKPANILLSHRPSAVGNRPENAHGPTAGGRSQMAEPKIADLWPSGWMTIGA